MVSRLFFDAHIHTQRTDPLNRCATIQYYRYQQPIIVNRIVLICSMCPHILYKCIYTYIFIWMTAGIKQSLIASS
jgi:hypothetical protein